VTCFVAVLWLELWLQWRSENCGRHCSGSYACRVWSTHQNYFSQAECKGLVRLHTSSCQHYPSSGFYSYHQLYYYYLQLTQDALSIRARVTTQHATSTYRMNTVMLYTEKVTKKFSEWKQVHTGMEPWKTNQTRWEWHHNTFTPSLYISESMETRSRWAHREWRWRMIQPILWEAASCLMCL